VSCFVDIFGLVDVIFFVSDVAALPVPNFGRVIVLDVIGCELASRAGVKVACLFLNSECKE
jgi:hypothetical protein